MGLSLLQVVDSQTFLIVLHIRYFVGLFFIVFVLHFFSNQDSVISKYVRKLSDEQIAAGVNVTGRAYPGN